MALDSFAFQELEEALGDGIIVTVTAATHAGLKAVCFKERLPVVTRILTALIGVNGYGRCWLSAPHRHQQGIEHQFLLDSRL